MHSSVSREKLFEKVRDSLLTPEPMPVIAFTPLDRSGCNDDARRHLMNHAWLAKRKKGGMNIRGMMQCMHGRGHGQNHFLSRNYCAEKWGKNNIETVFECIAFFKGEKDTWLKKSPSPKLQAIIFFLSLARAHEFCD